MKPHEKLKTLKSGEGKDMLLKMEQQRLARLREKMVQKRKARKALKGEIGRTNTPEGANVISDIRERTIKDLKELEKKRPEKLANIRRRRSELK